MTEREALKLALKALESLLDSFQRCEAGYPQHIEMRFAVRDTARIAIDRATEALAQPEQDEECKYCTDGCPACDARKLPEQEPVAWWRLAEDDGHQKYPIVSVEKPHPQWTTTRPLVFGDTSPPQRKPLTDEQLEFMERGFVVWPKSPTFIEVARAIEAAHGIKGEA